MKRGVGIINPNLRLAIELDTELNKLNNSLNNRYWALRQFNKICPAFQVWDKLNFSYRYERHLEVGYDSYSSGS